MIWKRLAKKFLVGAGMCTFGIGCAAVDALVSSPYGDDSDSPERLTAIARVFENQGHYSKARRLYNQALQKQPNNLFARERLVALKNRSSSRTFSNKSTAEAVAIADSLNANSQNSIAGRVPGRGSLPADSTAAKENTSTSSGTQSQAGVALLQAQPALPSSETQEAMAVVAEVMGEEPIARVVETALLEPDLAFAEEDFPIDEELVAGAGAFLPTVEEAMKVEAELTPGTPLPPVDEETSASSGPGLELAVATEESAPKGLDFAPATPDVQQIAFGEGTVVRLSEVLEWLDEPEEHTADLLRALQFGEDAGVCALAASGLGQCPADASFETALRASLVSQSELLKVTSLDALVTYQATQKKDVDALLQLAASASPGIRSQAAATLRNLAGTQWSEACVEGLGTLLDDTDGTVRLMAASTLGDFGKDAEPQRATLQRIAETDSWAAAAAQLALHRLDSAGEEESSEPDKAE